MDTTKNIQYSIIVPVFNAETTLNECVDSILKQEYKNFELILVDDGSKDSSPKICDEYAKKDERVIVLHQKNSGVSAARNSGLDIARGEWITFIDSDDFIEQNFLGDIDNDVDLKITRMKEFLLTKETMRITVNNSNKTVYEGDKLTLYIKKYVSSMIFRAPWAKFYKRVIIGNLRFKEDMKVAEDACFVLEYLSKVKSLASIPSGAYVFRLSPNPASVKYALTVTYAAQSLEHLHKAYNKVEEKFHIGHKSFSSFISSFKEMSKTDWSTKTNKWYKNSIIRNMYRYIWKELTIKEKFKLIISYIIKK